MDLIFFFVKNWNYEKIMLIRIWFAKNTGFESMFGYTKDKLVFNLIYQQK